MGTALDVGDEGIWVTYARGMKGKAVREFTAMCEEVGAVFLLFLVFDSMSHSCCLMWLLNDN